MARPTLELTIPTCVIYWNSVPVLRLERRVQGESSCCPAACTRLAAASARARDFQEHAMANEARSSGENQSVTRALGILNLLAAASEPLGVREIARRLRLPASNIQRLV